MSVAIVPVKRLAAGKSRLLPELDRRDLESLSLAMLGDILDALLHTPSLDRVAVATPDQAVAEFAEAVGATPVLRRDPGLNESIDAAAGVLDLDADEPLLVVLGDVAGALSEELESLFRILAGEMQGHGVVLAPSGDGGTSALLRAPAGVIPSCFGPDSAKHHEQATARAGIAFRALELPSLAVDLDRADDVELFLRTRRGGARTRHQLAASGWRTGSKDPS
jgi:2-phospho-L-lactate guanylyltransferase